MAAKSQAVMQSMELDMPILVEGRFRAIMSSYLDSDRSDNVYEITKSLDELFPSNRPAELQKGELETSGAFLWCFWDAFHKMGKRAQHDTVQAERLADLVVRMSMLTSRTPTVDLENWGSKFRLWEDLPLFSRTLWEASEELWRHSSDQNFQQEYFNLHMYMARIYSHGGPDLSYYAVAALNAAFDPKVSGDDVRLGSDAEFWVSLAAQWIMLAGRRLIEVTKSQNKAATDSAGVFSISGLTMECWKFWKQRFGAIAGFDGATQHMREQARLASEEIQRLL